ncbi:hypothetical protein U1Q18_004741 [Sarracenia purpurea var. burkii]
MASNQVRLLSSIIKLSAPKLGLSYGTSESAILSGSSIIKLSSPKLGLSYARSESAILSVSNSVRRLVSSSIEHPQRPPRDQQSDSNKLEGEESEIKAQNQDGNEDEDEGDDLDINKETGEIGGPRGPEPTRYGDWERNGRCSDF